jgi:hypothetical protein
MPGPSQFLRCNPARWWQSRSRCPPGPRSGGHRASVPPCGGRQRHRRGEPAARSRARPKPGRADRGLAPVPDLGRQPLLPEHGRAQRPAGRRVNHVEGPAGEGAAGPAGGDRRDRGGLRRQRGGPAAVRHRLAAADAGQRRRANTPTAAAKAPCPPPAQRRHQTGRGRGGRRRGVSMRRVRGRAGKPVPLTLGDGMRHAGQGAVDVLAGAGAGP